MSAAVGARLAIIPARGGSKRLPRKNIALVCGRPVLAYTIYAARACSLFDQIVVSTEDPEISDVAKAAGATVWPRSPALATDTATVDEVCIDVLHTYRRIFTAYPEYFCCLYATGALRQPNDIAEVYALLEPGACDFAISYRHYESNPLQALRLAPDGRLTPMWPDLVALPRQKRPPLVVDAGSIYWASTEAFLREETFYGSNLRGYPLPPERAVDIDCAQDLELMEIFMAKRLSTAKGA